MNPTRDSLLDVLRTLLKWRKTILTVTISTAVLVTVVSLLFLDNYFKASTLFYAASPDLARPEAFSDNQGASQEFFGNEQDIDRLLSIAESGELADSMIRIFDLYKHYDIDTAQPKAAFFVRQEFFDLYRVLRNELGAIEISVEDKDRLLSAEMANVARNQVDRIARRLIKESQERQINHYERTIREQARYLDELGDTLQRIRQQYSIFNTSSQGEALAELLANTRNTMIGQESLLQSLEAAGPRFRDSVVMVKAKVLATSRQLDSLRMRLKSFNEGVTTIEVLERELREAANRQSETKEKYKLLVTSRESDIAALHLIEEARTPVIKSRPKRSILIVGAAFLAFVFSAMGCLAVDSWGDITLKDLLTEKRND